MMIQFQINWIYKSVGNRRITKLVDFNDVYDYHKNYFNSFNVTSVASFCCSVCSSKICELLFLAHVVNFTAMIHAIK